MCLALFTLYVCRGDLSKETQKDLILETTSFTNYIECYNMDIIIIHLPSPILMDALLFLVIFYC